MGQFGATENWSDKDRLERPSQLVCIQALPLPPPGPTASSGYGIGGNSVTGTRVRDDA